MQRSSSSFAERPRGGRKALGSTTAGVPVSPTASGHLPRMRRKLRARSTLHAHQRRFDAFGFQPFLGAVGLVLHLVRADAHPVDGAAGLFALGDARRQPRHRQPRALLLGFLAARIGAGLHEIGVDVAARRCGGWRFAGQDRSGVASLAPRRRRGRGGRRRARRTGRAASAASAAAARRAARDPDAILSGRTPPAAAPGGDIYTYFVQAGAYSRSEEAEQQRARLAMSGLAARVTEREQAGRTVYRVRVGPYEMKDEADRAKERLETEGIEAALVRVQR